MEVLYKIWWNKPIDSGDFKYRQWTFGILLLTSLDWQSFRAKTISYKGGNSVQKHKNFVFKFLDFVYDFKKIIEDANQHIWRLFFIFKVFQSRNFEKDTYPLKLFDLYLFVLIYGYVMLTNFNKC